MSAQVEMWHVSTPEGVFEANLETLKQWIAEGAVLPTDKVSKGSLNWIEARRAPMLRLAFSLKSGNASSLQLAEKSDRPGQANISSTQFHEEVPSKPIAADDSNPSSANPALIANSNSVCQNHPDVSAHYVCRVCAATFCETCPRFVNKIPLCALCGDLCKLFQAEKNKVVRQEFQGSGFGFGDFMRALRYPFQHKIALLCGAIMYGLLLLAGFRGHVLAYVIMFGCISHVISQVAWGRLNRSFMPDLSSFSVWDDLAVPLGLGIGITIVTWGPVILLVFALIFGVLSYPGQSPVVPSGASEHSSVTEEDMSVLTDPEADPKKLEEANKKLQQTRPGYQISYEAEKSKNEQNDPAAGLRALMPFLQASLLIVLLLLGSLGWAIFYYPMALTVAGYTHSFGAVINPLVGLDTIRRMRGTYFKAFGMVLLLQIAGFIVSVIVAIITSPFALPFVGNLPAKVIDGSVTFYFNLVIACLLGLSLYKCADRLGISVD